MGRPTGRQLARRRLGRGWSQVVLARRLREAPRARGTNAGVNDEMISRWENGHRDPHPFYRILIEDLLGLPRERWEEDDPDVERREFLGTVGGVALGGAAVPGATLSRLMGVVAPPVVDDEQVEAWRADIESFQADYRTTPPGELLGPVATRLRAITALLREPQRPTIRQRLSRLGAELAGLRGRLAFDLHEPDTTELWYEVGLSLAEEADERLLAGWILGSHSLVALYRGDHERASSLLRRGLATTTGQPDRPTRAWLLAMSARAEAGLGQADRARQALRRARSTPGAPRPGERRYPLYFEGDDLFLGFHEALALKQVGELEPAERALESCVARRLEEDGCYRAAADDRLQLADVYLRAGDPDAAAHVASEALELLPDDEMVFLLRARVSRLRRRLDPFRDATAVRRLDETWTSRSL